MKTQRLFPDAPVATARAKALAADGRTQYWVLLSGADCVSLLEGDVPETVKAIVAEQLHPGKAESRAEYLARLDEAVEAQV